MAYHFRYRARVFEPGWQPETQRRNCRKGCASTSKRTGCMDLARRLLFCRDAVLIESFYQKLGYLISLPGLDLLAMENEDGLAITEQRHRRRRRRMAWK